MRPEQPTFKEGKTSLSLDEISDIGELSVNYLNSEAIEFSEDDLVSNLHSLYEMSLAGNPPIPARHAKKVQRLAMKVFGAQIRNDKTMHHHAAKPIPNSTANLAQKHLGSKSDSAFEMRYMALSSASDKLLSALARTSIALEAFQKVAKEFDNLVSVFGALSQLKQGEIPNYSEMESLYYKNLQDFERAFLEFQKSKDIMEIRNLKEYAEFKEAALPIIHFIAKNFSFSFYKSTSGHRNRGFYANTFELGTAGSGFETINTACLSQGEIEFGQMSANIQKILNRDSVLDKLLTNKTVENVAESAFKSLFLLNKI